MRLILDECLPKKLKQELPGHDVKTVPEMGWAGFTNGKLLSLIESHFDVFVTVDRNLAFQQNLKQVRIAVIVLSARANRFEDLKPLMLKVLNILENYAEIKGTVVHV